jgi:hypothetical protein
LFFAAAEIFARIFAEQRFGTRSPCAVKCQGCNCSECGAILRKAKNFFPRIFFPQRWKRLAKSTEGVFAGVTWGAKKSFAIYS